MPRAFVDLAKAAICHRDPERFALLYRLLVGIRAAPELLHDAADPLVKRVELLAKAVRRDIHKMRAFVRFRRMEDGDGERYVAWFEPEHHIVRSNAAFFVERFANMRWSILTPEISLHWDGATVCEGPGATRGDAPDGDPVEDAWARYYASIFNPARLKVGAMMKEMPRKYWANMPETAQIPRLVAGAQARSAAMIDASRAASIAPEVAAPGDAWTMLRDAARGCTRCPLFAPATQTVFGEGPTDAALMLIGEQPGDQEDRAGRAFIGPAGQLLDDALAEAGIDRARIYVTNAVKHFKFEQRGKRRIHQTPQTAEISACRWWVEEERKIVQPRLIVALGATAARSLFGTAMPVGKSRGRTLALADGTAARITVHPSYLLRLPDRAMAAVERAAFVEDLRAAAAIAHV